MTGRMWKGKESQREEGIICALAHSCSHTRAIATHICAHIVCYTADVPVAVLAPADRGEEEEEEEEEEEAEGAGEGDGDAEEEEEEEGGAVVNEALYRSTQSKYGCNSACRVDEDVACTRDNTPCSSVNTPIALAERFVRNFKSTSSKFMCSRSETKESTKVVSMTTRSCSLLGCLPLESS